MTGPPAPARPVLAGSGLSAVLRALGAVVAPATLVTSVLFYFGYMHAYWFLDYLGVHSTLLDLSTADLVIRSVDALFVPMVVVGGAGLALVWIHVAARPYLMRAPLPRAGRLTYVLGGLGLLLTLGGLASVFSRTVLDRWVAVAPLCLGAGVLVLLYTMRLRRSLRQATRAASPEPTRPWVTVAEWAAVFVLVALSVFWAAADYASAVGRSQARHYVESLHRQPALVLYSERSLRLDGPGVRELRCEDPDAAYQYRYDGLTLVLQSGGQYVLVPTRWSRADGVAFVIPRTDTLRLEFLPATAASAATPPATC